MPREQPCLDEASSSASSAKNAKDKSNSTTVQATQDSKHTDDSNGRSSHCSEKDSGYSDTGSDRQQTNAKDWNKKQSRETTDELPPNQNEKLKNHGSAIVAPQTQQLPSFYMIKNMVLEQPHIVQKNGQLLWSSGGRQNISGANSVILLQPPNMLPPMLPPTLRPKLQLSKSGLCKSNITGKKIKAAYLPILNSYPRIAPHPNKKPLNKMSPSDESLNQSKRVCIENKTHNSQQNRRQNRSLQEPHAQCKAVAASNSLPSISSPAVSSCQSTSSVSSITTSELNKNSIINTRHRRFLNTVQILKQSGLLDITLRTKELMRQSNATRRDIAQLRQHSELLCQMTNNSNQSPSNMAAWLNLHRIMADSGSYPDLKDAQALQMPATHPESSSKPQSVNGGDDGGPPLTSNTPSHAVTSVPDTSQTHLVPQQSQIEQTREDEFNETLVDRDTFTSPDSSTD